MTDTKEWLIRKNGYFYRPNKSGYTLEKAAAGRYTKDDADREAAIEPANFTVIHESEVEDAPQVVDLSAEITTLRKELAEARVENERLLRLATDRSYMLEAYRSMLGEKGLEVAKAWDEKGMVRCHFDWGPDGLKMTGEQRAEFILGIATMPHSEEETFAPPTRPAKHVSEYLRDIQSELAAFRPPSKAKGEKK